MISGKAVPFHVYNLGIFVEGTSVNEQKHLEIARVLLSHPVKKRPFIR